MIAESDPDGGEGDGVEGFARRASLEIARQPERLLASVRSGKNGRAQEFPNRSRDQMQSVHLCQRFRVLALRRVGTREIDASLLEFRIHFQRLAQLLDRLGVIPLEKVRLADVTAGDERSWIHLQRPLEGDPRFFRCPVNMSVLPIHFWAIM